MYCPNCFNNTLHLKSRGVVHLIINGKQMDAGRFLFNLEEMKKDKLESDLIAKLEEFFEWYSTFQNKDPINQVELCTVDFRCSSCSFSPSFSHRYSVVDVLVERKVVVALLKELTRKYHLELALKEVA